MKTILIGGALALATLVASASGAQAYSASAFDAGYRLALQRGYGPGQSVCFARIFATRATISPRGRWVVDGNAPYRDELWTRCRIGR